MGSYATISINDHQVFHYKNEVNPELFSLFDSNEKVHLKGKAAFDYDERRKIEDYDPEDLDHVEVHIYKTKAATIRDRLFTLGFNEEFLESIFNEARDEQIEHSSEMLADYEKSTYDHASDMRKMYREELATLKSLTFEGWLNKVKDYVSGDIQASQWEGPLTLIQSANERLVMFAIVASVDDDSTIELDVSDLYEGGWLSDSDGSSQNIEQSWFIETTPPIILTEGIFDRKVLTDAITLLRPALVPYFKFLDTDYKTEGGAPAIIKMLKSFAAAGISNRILVILDNDTAAHEALTAIQANKLPSHFGIMTLPDLELLDSYPTIGPQGLTEMNINGLAAAIELYLGRDVLEREDKTLSPIQWTGYSNKMATYQGELNEKSIIQGKFKDKVKMAKLDKNVLVKQDWAGMNLIIDTMLLKLGNLR